MKAYHDAAAHTFTDRPMNEALTTVSMTLVATDETDRTIGVLSATAPGTLIDMAMNNGFTAEKAMALSLFVAKIHGLAVAEQARGQGIAAALLKRTWQVHQQLGYRLLYGSYETDRDLAAFYTRAGAYDAIRAAVIRLIRSREIRSDSSAGPVYFVLYDVESEPRARELAAALHAALYGDLEPLARAVPEAS
ncbi:hypothetical protein Stsp02_32750 [Streptomyces sp. NBRC 14336]|uniref:GNAT family N-acetyltransferase n=1 Tax=Streptomyces TaxID=1883 RepID=UPI001F10569B|nr:MULTISPECIES: GNAT family N-acetyltransferase [Streptomyces]GLW47613.1 hypothetical protein Stsp02_32750 [Streptomyces sp. NBRC 14336]